MRLQIFTFLLLLFLWVYPAYPTSVVKAIVSPEPKNYAWWLRTEFIPAHKEIRGIPVQQLDPSWHLGSELSKEAIPNELLFQGGADIMKAPRLSFSRFGDFNQDGVEDLAVIGVYQDNEEKRGSFILILTKGPDGKLHKSFLEQLGKPSFAALSEKDPMEVWFCMECNYGVYVLWNKVKGEYKIEPFPNEEND